MNNEPFTLPNTDNPEVMHRAVTAALVNLVWDEVIRTADLDELEEKAINVFNKIYKGIGASFQA